MFVTSRSATIDQIVRDDAILFKRAWHASESYIETSEKMLDCSAALIVQFDQKLTQPEWILTYKSINGVRALHDDNNHGMHNSAMPLG